jgi:predicted DNA binding CopG/RHH family protein
MMNIDDLICELLEQKNVVDKNGGIEFTSRSVELIHNIANRCNEIGIVQETKEQAEEYAKDLTAEQIYLDMLNKIVEAPTRIHMRLSARMLIPIIDRKLKEGNVQ